MDTDIHIRTVEGVTDTLRILTITAHMASLWETAYAISSEWIIAPLLIVIRAVTTTLTTVPALDRGSLAQRTSAALWTTMAETLIIEEDLLSDSKGTL